MEKFVSSNSFSPKRVLCTTKKDWHCLLVVFLYYAVIPTLRIKLRFVKLKLFLFSFSADKLVIRDGKMWCLDVFDRFVSSGQSVTLGEAVVRRYRPVTPVTAGSNGSGSRRSKDKKARTIVLGIFASDSEQPEVRIDRQDTHFFSSKSDDL